MSSAQEIAAQLPSIYETAAQPSAADSQRAEQIASSLPSTEESAPAQSAPAQSAPPAPQGFVDKYIVPVGQGLGDIARTAEKVFDASPMGRMVAPARQWLAGEIEKSSNPMAQALGATMTQGSDAENQLYNEREAGNAAAPWLRLGGQAATTLPFMAAAPEAAEATIPGMADVGTTGAIFGRTGALARMVGRGLTGSLQGATAAALTSSANPMPVGEQIAGGALIGGPLGAVAGPAAEWIGGKAGGLVKGIVGLIRKTGAKIEGIPEAGAIPEQAASGIDQAFESQHVNPESLSPSVKQSVAQEVEQQINTTGVVKPEQVARKASLLKWGFQPLRAMVTRNPEDWTQLDEDLASSQGNKLLKVIQKNNYVAAKNLEDMKLSTGGAAETPAEAAHSIEDAVTGKWDAWQKRVGDMYKEVEQSAGKDMGLEPNELLSTFDQMGDNAEWDTLRESVKRRLTRLGVMDAKGDVKNGTPLTVGQAEDLRKFIGGLGGSTPTARMGKNMLIDALDQDVIDTAGGDAFAGARQEAAKRFAQFKDSGILQSIIEGRGNPDTLMERYVIGRGGKAASADALENLKQSLLTNAEGEVSPEGEAAWNDLRRQVMHWVQDQARANVHGGLSAENAGELKQFAQAGFERALQRIGPQKLAVLFGNDGAEELASLAAATRNAMVPPSGAVANFWKSQSGTLAGRLGEKALSGMADEPWAFMQRGKPVGAAISAGSKLASYLSRKGSIARSLAGTGAETQSSNQLLRSVPIAAYAPAGAINTEQGGQR